MSLRKLTAQQVHDAAALYRTGTSLALIAESHGVTYHGLRRAIVDAYGRLPRRMPPRPPQSALARAQAYLEGLQAALAVSPLPNDPRAADLDEAINAVRLAAKEAC